jgi:hypothetical protein
LTKASSMSWCTFGRRQLAGEGIDIGLGLSDHDLRSLQVKIIVSASNVDSLNASPTCLEPPLNSSGGIVPYKH